MNGIRFMNREIKVNWASGSTGKEVAPGATNKIDYNRGTHIFVGDIAADVTEDILKEAFKPFGALVDVKIIRYPVRYCLFLCYSFFFVFSLSIYLFNTFIFPFLQNSHANGKLYAM